MADQLRVIEPGLFSTIQDEGRFGWQRFGISAAGAMDRPAMILANALVGNAPDAAVIEATLTGPTLVVEAESCRLAWTGMPAHIRVDGSPVPAGRAFDCARGQTISIAAGPAGMRGYLAVSGGFAIPPVLGSCSTHTRSGLGGLGGRALMRGDIIPLAATSASGPLREASPEAMPEGVAVVRVVLGPQDDHFTAEGIATFLGSEYRVSHRADRMGMQLEGPQIAHAGGFNIVSDGIMNGSIQVPGHGRPVVLLADRQSTGGYPKIATVIGPDLAVLAQLRPGAALRFVALSPDDAEAAAAQARDALVARLAALREVADAGDLLAAERLLSLNLVDGGVHEDL